jgi:hypothetical protein
MRCYRGDRRAESGELTRCISLVGGGARRNAGISRYLLLRGSQVLCDAIPLRNKHPVA